MLQRVSLIFAHLVMLAIPTFSQEEGPAVARSRFDKPNTIIIGGGLSLTLGQNVGDYSKGFNLEVGFQHRLNKLVSIGGFLSQSKFNYDPSKSPTSPQAQDLFTGDESDLQISSTASQTYRDLYIVPADYTFRHGYQLSFGGGDLSLTSIGGNIRFDLIPYSEKVPVSVYVLARPYLTLANRTEVYGTATRYLYQAYVDPENGLELNTNDDTWYPDGYFEEWGVQGGFDALKAKTNVTAGLQVGPGIEIRPSSSVSIFAQALIGYTLPVSFISTVSFERSLAGYRDKSFPVVSEGFPSIGIQAGVGFNF